MLDTDDDDDDEELLQIDQFHSINLEFTGLVRGILVAFIIMIMTKTNFTITKKVPSEVQNKR